MTIDGFRLPPILEPEHIDIAIDAVRRYFAIDAVGTPAFSGGGGGAVREIRRRRPPT